MSQIVQFVSNSGAGGFVQTLTGNNAVAVPPAAGNINIVGAGSVLVTGNAGTNTLTITDTGGGLPWTVVVTSQGMAVNNGYIANGVGTVVLTLPAVSPVGSIIRVTGINNATGWQISQGAGQQIFIAGASTTLGATGTLTSSATRDSVELVCVVANTTFNAISMIGNPTPA